MIKKLLFLGAISVLALSTAPVSYAVEAEVSHAQTAEEGGTTCRNAGVFSMKLINNVCWSCMFPIKVSGITVSGGKNKNRVPYGSSNAKGLCVCYDNLGVGMPGIPSSFWEPYRLAEYVRTPGCSQVLLGKRFPFDKLNQGVSVNNATSDQKNGIKGAAFFHYHYYSFPVTSMLSMYMPENCNPGYFKDLDVLYLSEVDPTWQHDDLAFFTNPESALFANPLTAISCIPDAFAAMVDDTFTALWWCAGSWGSILSPSGNLSSGTHTLNATSLELTRMLYVLHRRGIEWGTVGEENACGGNITVNLPKQQYRMSLFYPVSEADDNHILGRSELFWGAGKLIPGFPEDPIYILWRWLDCCAQ